MNRGAWTAAVIAVLGVVMGGVLLSSQRASTAEAATAFVTSSADSGPGTFRAAIEAANASSSVNLIVLTNTLPVQLTSQVTYTGNQDLVIQGNSVLSNRVIQGNGYGGNAVAEGCDALFRSSGGARNLTFQSVTFQNTYCSAVVIYASDSSQTTRTVTLTKTIIQHADGYGLEMYEGGSPAATSWVLTMTNSHVEDTALCFGDGVAVYEHGWGGIRATITGSSSSNNGGTGLDLEEEDDGDISLTATMSSFNGNGEVDPESVSTAGADDDSTLVGALADSGPTAQCCDYDGINVDENDLGRVTIVLQTVVQASGNAGHGINVHENYDGDISFTASGVIANDNCNDGIHVREYGNGSLSAQLVNVTTAENWDDGTDIDENGNGNLRVQATASSANSNGDDGYDLDEGCDGSATFVFTVVSANNNDDDGIDLSEEQNGAFNATLAGSFVQGNGDYGIEAYAENETGLLNWGGSIVLGGIYASGVTVIP
ncbi:MAG: hypothetical protein K1X87_10550 [Dehalococcoidia bacterium]|nr:hypothetical protein [Dehalococcoidia bacterium]